MRIFRHLRTIHEHRKLVREGCFRVGLYYQGLTHDLSKYSPQEFFVGAKYYQGYRSPNNAEREKKGFSSAWLHHKGRNKHHFEYWVDYNLDQNDVKTTIPTQMPKKYLVEMYIDRVAASATYNKGHFMYDLPYKYYLKGKDKKMIEVRTRYELEKLLAMLAEQGPDATEEYIRKVLLKGRPGAVIAQLLADHRRKKRVSKNHGR